MKKNDAKFISLKDAARRIGICERAMRQMVAERAITFYLVGSKYLFNIDKLDKWMEEHRVDAV